MVATPLPVPTAPFRLAMGLQGLKLHDWIELDGRYPQQLALREDLLRSRHDEVCAAIPGSAPAVEELQETLVEHLLRRFPDNFAAASEGMIRTPDGRTVPLGHDAPARLAAMGRLVQEDFCLLQAEGPTAPYHLTAAILCFPTRWKLREKLGRPLSEIHAPVPGYEAALARPVDRFFTLLRPDKPVWRTNWSLLDDPALFQPEGHFRGAYNPAITAENAGEGLHLRIERQTLRRLPRTGAIVFGIRVHQQPLGSIAADPAAARDFAAALRSVPADLSRYKSLPPVRRAALEWLDRVAAGRALA